VSVTADPSNNGPLADLAANRRLVLDALARLPVEQRTVIRRSYYDACTVAQIADDLQVDQMTVTTRLHYGVRALLLSLEERGITRHRGTAPRPRSSPPAQQDSGRQDGSLQDLR
jgi:RNA polymerase sigma-70 factor (ECF subfamily)